MSTVVLTEDELAVLEALGRAPEWQFMFFSVEVQLSPETVKVALKSLRAKKLVDVDGRGKWAQYSIGERGKATLALLAAAGRT